MRESRSTFIVRFWRAGRGVASVEFVIIMPVLLVMLMVAIDMGRLLFDYHAVSKSIRDATRYLTRVDDGAAALAIDCASGTVNVASTEVRNAMRLAMTGRFDGDPALDPLVATWTATSLTTAATGINVWVECMDNSAAVLQGFYAGETLLPGIVMSAGVPFNFKLGGLFQIGPQIVFNISHKMAHIGT